MPVAGGHAAHYLRRIRGGQLSLVVVVLAAEGIEIPETEARVAERADVYGGELALPYRLL